VYLHNPVGYELSELGARQWMLLRQPAIAVPSARGITGIAPKGRARVGRRRVGFGSLVYGMKDKSPLSASAGYSAPRRTSVLPLSTT
jgi:hypothetical protein